MEEAYGYDVYGRMSGWNLDPEDFNGSGKVDLDDYAVFLLAFLPAYNPVCDLTGNGVVNLEDFATFAEKFLSIATPTPVSLLDNRYQFTGRPMWLFQHGGDTLGIQHHRARWYHTRHGRWLTRDPIGTRNGDESFWHYRDGSNLYVYVRSNPSAFGDAFGLELDARNEAVGLT